MNSRTEFCDSAALGEVCAVWTTIPSVAVSVQAACGFGIPSTSHEAHAAGADRRAEARLVAEDRDLDPGLERRLDDPEALRHLNLAAVDRDGDQFWHAHQTLRGQWLAGTVSA